MSTHLTNSDVLGRLHTLTRAHVHTYVHTHAQLTNSDVLNRLHSLKSEQVYKYKIYTHLINSDVLGCMDTCNM